MHIVIDIEERVWMNQESIRESAFEYESGSGFDKIIRNGLRQAIVLPKGHGDLVDRDKVIDLLNEQEYNYYTELDKVCDTVYEAEAIIEADKESDTDERV